ncbi:MAG: SpoIIE family protein phosphatase [Fimbriimonadaceae bacterium]|nr:SpoIIE family protein phosphatase [Fimbriimonadaceae bacterium]
MAALAYGVVSRPKKGNVECGDAWAVFDDGDAVTVTVADGLGSGSAARTASQAAVEAVGEHRQASLPRVFAAADAALRQTRGAALAVLRVDAADHRVLFAGLGNVELRSLAGGGFRAVPTSGIVGTNFRPPKVFEGSWRPGDWLVLHSDGLTTHFDLDDELRASGGQPQELADRLAASYARDHDDLTVLALRLDD